VNIQSLPQQGQRFGQRAGRFEHFRAVSQQFLQGVGSQAVSADRQPRRAASIVATSIFPIVIIASKARFPSPLPTIAFH
jgi:hypothetical protein